VHTTPTLRIPGDVERRERRIGRPLTSATCRARRHTGVAHEVSEVLVHPVGSAIKGRDRQLRHSASQAGLRPQHVGENFSVTPRAQDSGVNRLIYFACFLVVAFSVLLFLPVFLLLCGIYLAVMLAFLL
jgi:hypothetical protein